MHHSDKDFINKFKLYFATLFARSMPIVIVGCSSLADNQFIYSNIPLEKMELLENSSTYYLHDVKITDEQFMQDLYEVFPLFKSHIFMLNVSKICSAIGKHTGLLKDIILKEVAGVINITVLDKKLGMPLITECGQLISNFVAHRYLEVYTQAYIGTANTIMYDFKQNITKINLAAPHNTIEIPLSTGKICKLVLLNNGSCVSVKEFIPKSKITDYAYSIYAKLEKNTVVANAVFTSKEIQVTSVHPAVIWFTQKQQHNSLQ